MEVYPEKMDGTLHYAHDAVYHVRYTQSTEHLLQLFFNCSTLAFIQVLATYNK